jgi:hypothetical protein
MELIKRCLICLTLLDVYPLYPILPISHTHTHTHIYFFLLANEAHHFPNESNLKLIILRRKMQSRSWVGQFVAEKDTMKTTSTFYV